MTYIETLGFHRLSEIERNGLEMAIGRMKVLALDDTVIKQTISLRQKRNIGLADAIIASTALIHGLPLVTRNVNDFKNVDGLKLINPFENT